ncbi:MAG: hypothetical protein ACI3W5_05810 [Faecousia sp.]
MNVFEKIASQQKGKEGQPSYMVGEQLKDICRREPEIGDLVEKDLDTITLDAVANKLKARADELHQKQKGSCVCITPMEAERIIREAYGLPEAARTEAREQQKKEDSEFLDLADFL